MPKVGTKKYPYTPAGVKQAMQASKKSGKKMSMKSGKKGMTKKKGY